MRDEGRVGTKLKIDAALQAARKSAGNRRKTTSEMLSDLARQAIEPRHLQPIRSGVRLLARRRHCSRKPTMNLVNRLRDET